MLTPRLVQVQGFGSTTRLIALQGLWPAPSSAVIGGGAGRGPVKRNGWTEDDEQGLKHQLQLRQDEDFLLLAVLALTATRRLH